MYGRWSVAMGQLVLQGVVIGVVMSVTMTSIVTDRSSLRAAIYIFTPKSEIRDAKNMATKRFLDDVHGKVDFDYDKWPRKTRNGAVSSGRKHGTAFKCHEMMPWARAVIQTTVDSDLEDTYYHVPRAAFIQRPSSAVDIAARLNFKNTFLDPTFTDYHPQCHPQCPVRLRLLPPEPDRLWPRNLVVAECACKETSCFSRGKYQCREVTTPVLTVRGAPGQRPRYCPEMVPAGCRCIPVRIMSASHFEPFAIT